MRLTAEQRIFALTMAEERGLIPCRTCDSEAFKVEDSASEGLGGFIDVLLRCGRCGNPQRLHLEGGEEANGFRGGPPYVREIDETL